MTLPKQVTQFFQNKAAVFLFSDDPIFEMLRWLLSEFMKAESETRVSAEKLKQIWLQLDLDSLHRLASVFIEKYKNRFPEATECLLEGLEDSMQFYHFPLFDKRKISSTNALERLNREIRCRTRVVGIFPSRDAYIRLVTTYVLE